MNTFKVITNATTIINDDLIIDPWIYGNVYYDAWSPYPDPKYPKKKIKEYKVLFYFTYSSRSLGFRNNKNI